MKCSGQHLKNVFTIVVKVTYVPTDFSVLVRAYGKGSERIIDRKQEVVVSCRIDDLVFFSFLCNTLLEYYHIVV